MSRPAPSIFLFNRSYRTMPTVHAVVVQANPGVPTRFVESSLLFDGGYAIGSGTSKS